VIIHQQIGRSKEATRTAEQLMAARPTFTIAAWLKTRFIRRDTAQVEADTALFASCWVSLVGPERHLVRCKDMSDVDRAD
jgi:hypothetical protein